MNRKNLLKQTTKSPKDTKLNLLLGNSRLKETDISKLQRIKSLVISSNLIFFTILFIKLRLFALDQIVKLKQEKMYFDFFKYVNGLDLK